MTASADTAQAEVAPSSAAATPGGGGRPMFLGMLIVWILLGLALLGIIFFGGYEGQPVEDLSTLNPLKHHAVFGPAFFVWIAGSCIGVPRLLLRIFERG